MMGHEYGADQGWFVGDLVCAMVCVVRGDARPLFLSPRNTSTLPGRYEAPVVLRGNVQVLRHPTHARHGMVAIPSLTHVYVSKLRLKQRDEGVVQPSTSKLLQAWAVTICDREDTRRDLHLLLCRFHLGDSGHVLVMSTVLLLKPFRSIYTKRQKRKPSHKDTKKVVSGKHRCPHTMFCGTHTWRLKFCANLFSGCQPQSS